MSKRTRRNRVALVAVTGEKTLAELAQQSDVHPNHITTWKPSACHPDLLRRPGALARSAQLGDGAAGVFGSEPKAGLAAPAIDVRTLHAKIGELTSTNDLSSARSARACPEPAEGPGF